VETACSSDVDAYEYVTAAFGVSTQEFAEFYADTLRSDNELGPWPQFSIPIAGHTLSITYFGTPRHETAFGISKFGQVYTVAKLGGHGVRPGFRWEEVEMISHHSTAREITLLLLLPACDIPLGRAKEAAQVINQCFNTLGYDGPLIERFAGDLANRLASDRTWRYDDRYGWVTDDWQCWRSREPRVARGLMVAPDEQFFCLKELTAYLSSHAPPA
jgi:hypothetical protein